MWQSNCLYCKREIKVSQACYPVYSEKTKEKLGYRCVNCHPDNEEENIPFGNVTDLKGELE